MIMLREVINSESKVEEKPDYDDRSECMGDLGSPQRLDEE